MHFVRSATPHDNDEQMVTPSSPWWAWETFAAAECSCTPKTLRRHLAAPDGLLRAQIEKARAAQAEAAQDELAPLRAKALAVLQAALDQGDVGAAKALLSKLVASPTRRRRIPSRRSPRTTPAGRWRSPSLPSPT